MSATAMNTEFIGSALTMLSCQIQQYCRSAPERLADLRGKARAIETRRFIQMAQRLSSDLRDLLKLAHEVHALRSLPIARMEEEAAVLDRMIEGMALREMVSVN